MMHEVQRANILAADQASAPVAQQHQLLPAHSNSPQVGWLALQASVDKDVEAYPLDVLGAQTEGMNGSKIEQELRNLLPMEVASAKKHFRNSAGEMAVRNGDGRDMHRRRRHTHHV